MRMLTTKQKKLLDEWYEENKEKVQQDIAFFDLCDYEEFSLEFIRELELINDTEILFQNINRYIIDKGGKS